MVIRIKEVANKAHYVQLLTDSLHLCQLRQSKKHDYGKKQEQQRYETYKQILSHKYTKFKQINICTSVLKNYKVSHREIKICIHRS